MVIFASNKKNIIKSIIMSTFQKVGEKMTNFRWIICGLLFFATTVNYLDRHGPAPAAAVGAGRLGEYFLSGGIFFSLLLFCVTTI